MAWIEGALRPEWVIDDLMAHVEAGRAALVSKHDGGPAGLAVAQVDLPETGAACVPFIAIAPAERFRGLGGEAGLALEAHLGREFGVRRVLAPVPEGRGLAVYFWLRLGYRPLIQVDAPWPLIGLDGKGLPGIWMARDVFIP
jgi:hypothetical protein